MTKKVMKLVDKEKGLMQCTVCEGLQQAEKTKEGRFRRGSWECSNGCVLGMDVEPKKFPGLVMEGLNGAKIKEKFAGTVFSFLDNQVAQLEKQYIELLDNNPPKEVIKNPASFVEQLFCLNDIQGFINETGRRLLDLTKESDKNEQEEIRTFENVR